MLEKREQCVVRTIAWRRSSRGGGACESLLLEPHVGVQVDLGGLDGLMSEPEGDDAPIDAALQQLHCGRVPQGVRRDPLVHEGRAAPSCGGDVLRYQTLDGIRAQASAPATGEDRLIGLQWPLVQPCREHFFDVRA